MVVEFIVALGVPVWLCVEAVLHFWSIRPPVEAAAPERVSSKVAA